MDRRKEIGWFFRNSPKCHFIAIFLLSVRKEKQEFLYWTCPGVDPPHAVHREPKREENRVAARQQYNQSHIEILEHSLRTLSERVIITLFINYLQ